MSLKIELANRFVAASFGYVFKDNSLLKQALDTTGLRVRESNQRLALLGDRIIAFLVTDAWYSTGTSKGTGQNNVSHNCCNAKLAELACAIGLGKHIEIHPGQQTASSKLLATTIEVLFGAIYLDSDKDVDTVKFARCRLGTDANIDWPF